MKQKTFVFTAFILILFWAVPDYLRPDQKPFYFPKEIKYDFREKGNMVSVCTYRYEKAAKGAKGKDVSSLILECTRPISLHDADNFHTTVSSKNFTLLFAVAGKGKEMAFDIEVREIKGEKKFAVVYTGGKTLDKHTEKVSDKYEVIDFISTFFVASQRVAKGIFKKNRKFNLLQGKKVKTVEMKHLGEDNVDYHGARIPVQVMALVHDKEEILRLEVYPEEGGFCYPINVKFSDKNTIFEMNATDVQKPKGAHPSKTKLMFLSTLSFMDANKRTIKNPSETAALVNNAFIEEMKKQISESGQGILIDKEGHTIPGKDENVQRLIDIAFGSSDRADKLKEINDKFMTPHNVDIIIVGQYVDYTQNSRFIIRPVMIFKSHRQIVTRSLLLDLDKVICWDANKKAVFCGKGPRYITKEVTEFLSYWPGAPPKKQPPPSGQSSTRAPTGGGQTTTTPTQPQTTPTKTKPKPSKTQQPVQKQPQSTPKTTKPSSKTPTKTHSPPKSPPGNMTIEDVYRMILKYKLFCNWSDDHHHDKVMQKLLKAGLLGQSQLIIEGTGGPVNRYLRSGWTTKIRLLKEKRIMKTVSAKIRNPKDSIVLYWTLTMLDEPTYNYKNAIKEIRVLNNENHRGYSDWRLPHIEEIFLILSHNFKSGNFFPFNSASGKLLKTLKIWTCTPVEEDEKRIHGGCRDSNDAFFIINNIHDKDYHSISFDIACTDENAYVLAVRSDQPTTLPTVHVSTKPLGQSKPLTSPTHTHKKITTPPKPPVSTPVQTLHFVTLPYWDFYNAEPLDIEEVRLVNEVVLEALEIWAKGAKKRLVRSQKHIPNPKKAVEELIEIALDRHLPPENRIKKMKTKVKIPKEIEIIITGQYSDLPGASRLSIRPVVIFKSKEKSLTRNFSIPRGELVGVDPRTKEKKINIEAKNSIIQLIETALKDLNR